MRALPGLLQGGLAGTLAFPLVRGEHASLRIATQAFARRGGVESLPSAKLLADTGSLTPTGVTPGSYTNTNLTVGADGRIVTASNGSTGAATFSKVTPNFATEVSSLHHFEGADGSTTVTDQVAGNTWTCVGSTAIRTAQSVFGSSSLLVPSGACALTMPTNSKYDVGSGDWTFRTRLRSNGTPGSNARIFQTRNGDVFCGIGIYWSSTGAVNVSLSSNGTSFNVLNGWLAMNCGLTGWNDICIERQGNYLFAFLDGYCTGKTGIGSASLYYNAADTVIFGGQAASSRSSNCYYDEFQFVKGKAVIAVSPDYTIETSPFPDS